MTRASASRGRIAVVASGVALAGCGTTSSGQGGAVAGLGAASTRVASSATYIEALQGWRRFASRRLELGKSDRSGRSRPSIAPLEAAPGGQPVAWQGRGVSGSVVAAAPYQVG